MSSTNLKDYLGYGLKADRPASPPLSTATSGFYYATDTEELSYWKGSWGAWRSAGVSTPTLQSVTNTPTFTPAATDDVCVISAQAEALTMAAPAGTSDGRRTIVFKIKASGAYGITWDPAYRWIGTPYTTTVAGKWAYITGIYNATDSVMDLMTPQVQP